MNRKFNDHAFREITGRQEQTLKAAVTVCTVMVLIAAYLVAAAVLLPQSEVLLQKWGAYLKMGCLASEMESATLFIVGGYRKVRTGTVLLVMANQVRAAKGLENPVVHDTDSAIRTAIEAVRVLIRKDGARDRKDSASAR